MLQHATTACATPDFSAKSSKTGDCVIEKLASRDIEFIFCAFQLKCCIRGRRDGLTQSIVGNEDNIFYINK